jgi:hypothetical protein
VGTLVMLAAYLGQQMARSPMVVPPPFAPATAPSAPNPTVPALTPTIGRPVVPPTIAPNPGAPTDEQAKDAYDGFPAPPRLGDPVDALDLGQPVDAGKSHWQTHCRVFDLQRGDVRLRYTVLFDRDDRIRQVEVVYPGWPGTERIAKLLDAFGLKGRGIDARSAALAHVHDAAGWKCLNLEERGRAARVLWQFTKDRTYVGIWDTALHRQDNVCQ